MRHLTGHKVNGANGALTISVLDEVGAGNANHLYCIQGMNTGTNAASDGDPETCCKILFQNGPITEEGVNGVTQEALIEVCIDRLRSFQDGGKFACRENAIALTKLEEAQMWLQKRTIQRLARGVEGTHTV